MFGALYRPVRKYTSIKFSPIASCLISASFGPGSGVGTSSHTMTSGPPFACMRIAFVTSSLHTSQCLQQEPTWILQRQQQAFRRQPIAAGVAADMRRSNHPVAGDDQGNRIAAIGLTNRARAAAGSAGNIQITARLAVRN